MRAANPRGTSERLRAVARFVPDCAVLFSRLLRDPRVPLGDRLLLVGLVAYLALPFDLVPDFIPVLGQLDDALVVALALRKVVRSGGRALVAAHWPGPPSSLELLVRVTEAERPGSARGA